MVEHDDIVEGFEQIKNDIRFPVLNGGPCHRQIVLQTQRFHFVTKLLQRTHHVVLGFPLGLLGV